MRLDHFGETVRLSILGLGNRGFAQLGVLLGMKDMEITVLCDVFQEKLDRAAEKVFQERGRRPFCTTNHAEAMDRADVDAVVIMTGWQNHIDLSIQAMRLGKRVALEVGGGSSVDECWQLVRVSEETGIPVMLLENCCYGETELALQNMIRRKVFGTLVHCAGAYSHDLREGLGRGDLNKHYRQAQFIHRNGELYPTHELGPIANYLDINRGNRMLTLTSMASKACGLHEWAVRNRPNDPIASTVFNEGDIVTTLIKCANGETIQMTHDCSLPCAYSRGGVVRGTKGMWMEAGRQIFLEGRTPTEAGSWAHVAESDKKYMEEYQHPLWKEYYDFGLRGGHGGMDYLVLRAFVESVQNQSEPPIDVYDTASWLSITALSEESIAKGSMPVAIPDFTNGRWCLERKNPARAVFTLE